MHILDWMVLFPCIQEEHTDKDEAKKYAFESLIWKNKKIKIKLEGQLSWGLKFYKNHSGVFFFFLVWLGGSPLALSSYGDLTDSKNPHDLSCSYVCNQTHSRAYQKQSTPSTTSSGIWDFCHITCFISLELHCLQSVYICLPVFDYGKAKEQTTVIYSKYPWFMHYKQAKGSLSN